MTFWLNGLMYMKSLHASVPLIQMAFSVVDCEPKHFTYLQEDTGD